MRIEKIPVTTETIKYIADDGSQFDTELECVRYEEAKAEEKAKEDKLKRIEKYIVHTLDDQYPIHADASFGEYCYFTWFRVDSEEEYEELKKLIDDNPLGGLKEIIYPAYIGYELEDEFYDTVSVSDYSYTLSEAMEITKDYFKKFGYNVKFEIIKEG